MKKLKDVALPMGSILFFLGVLILVVHYFDLPVPEAVLQIAYSLVGGLTLFIVWFAFRNWIVEDKPFQKRKKIGE